MERKLKSRNVKVNTDVATASPARFSLPGRRPTKAVSTTASHRRRRPSVKLCAHARTRGASCGYGCDLKQDGAARCNANSVGVLRSTALCTAQLGQVSSYEDTHTIVVRHGIVWGVTLVDTTGVCLLAGWCAQQTVFEGAASEFDMRACTASDFGEPDTTPRALTSVQASSATLYLPECRSKSHQHRLLRLVRRAALKWAGSYPTAGDR